MTIINDIIQNSKTRMQKCVELLKMYINKIHINRISPNILNNLQIKNNEKNFIPIQHLSSISVKDAHTLSITVFDPTIVKIIEKSIITSDLNLHVSSNGNTIYAYLSPLTEERRLHLIKLVRIESEKTRIALRNIRRSTNDQIKILMKNKKIAEEEKRHLQNTIQTFTNTWNDTVNKLLETKEIELKTSNLCNKL